MYRNVCYKLLCNYCAYRLGFDSMCGLTESCAKCDNSDTNHTCKCCKDKPEGETTCPYFRYLSR